MRILTKTKKKALEKALTLSPEKIIERVKKSGLIGKGGASFPTGLKWEFTNKSPEKERYLICNADEGEPGGFKDKFIIQNNPELLIEGILIACHALQIKKAYIYLRKEYSYLVPHLKGAFESFKPQSEKIEIILGAGAYICGEETAIMNSIEGFRGNPRKRPPYPAEKGLWGKPTCINNVETLSDVPLILLDDSWDKDIRLFSISGDVLEGGIFEEPLGITMGELIKKAKPKEAVKALSFGASGGFVPYEEGRALIPEKLAEEEVFMGSATIMVIGKSRSILQVCKNLQQFFVHESCGKCFPCREGTAQCLLLLEKMERKEATKADLKLLEELVEFIKEASFCALGQFSVQPLLTAFKFFKDEFEETCKS